MEIVLHDSTHIPYLAVSYVLLFNDDLRIIFIGEQHDGDRPLNENEKTVADWVHESMKECPDVPIDFFAECFMPGLDEEQNLVENEEYGSSLCKRENCVTMQSHHENKRTPEGCLRNVWYHNVDPRIAGGGTHPITPEEFEPEAFLWTRFHMMSEHRRNVIVPHIRNNYKGNTDTEKYLWFLIELIEKDGTGEPMKRNSLQKVAANLRYLHEFENFVPEFARAIDITRPDVLANYENEDLPEDATHTFWHVVLLAAYMDLNILARIWRNYAGRSAANAGRFPDAPKRVVVHAGAGHLQTIYMFLQKYSLVSFATPPNFAVDIAKAFQF